MDIEVVKVKSNRGKKRSTGCSNHAQKEEEKKDIFVIDGIHKKRGGMYLELMMVSPCFFTMRQVCYNSDKNKSAIGSVGRRKMPLKKSDSQIRLKKHRKTSNSQVHTRMV